MVYISMTPIHTAWNDTDFEKLLSHRAQSMKASAIRELLKITQQPDIVSFAGGLPAPELFPLDDIRAAFERVMNKYGPAAMQYSTTEGHLPLREWIAAQHGIAPHNVQIVTGSQQGLDLLGKILINEGDVVLVETPTYMGALQSFQPYLPQYLPIPTDEHGIDVHALDKLLAAHQGRKPKLLYTIPNFQNPTGITLSMERREALLDLCLRHGILILEDDPYGQLRFTGVHLPSLFELALKRTGNVDSVNVVYSSSFSKVLVPGMRDAWVAGPDTIIHKLVQAKQGADLHTPTVTQMMIAELVEEVLPRQIATVRQAYGKRAQYMMSQMKLHFPEGAHYTTPEGGMFLWVSLPQRINTTELFPKAIARKVAYVPGAPFYALGGGENTMRLSYSNATPEQIEAGIKALGDTFKEVL